MPSIEVAIIHCLLLLTPSLETMDTLVDDSMDMVKKPLGEGPNVFRRLAAPPKALVRFLNWDKRWTVPIPCGRKVAEFSSLCVVERVSACDRLCVRC